MSQDETRRLLAVAGSLKVRVLLSLGYGCGRGRPGAVFDNHHDRPDHRPEGPPTGGCQAHYRAIFVPNPPSRTTDNALP